jgi:hypothetical protein
VLAAEGGLYLAFKDDKGLFEVVAVRRWASAGWNVHVDKAEATGGPPSGEQDGVGVADETDVEKVWLIGADEGEAAGEVVGWK